MDDSFVHQQFLWTERVGATRGSPEQGCVVSGTGSPSNLHTSCAARKAVILPSSTTVEQGIPGYKANRMQLPRGVGFILTTPNRAFLAVDVPPPSTQFTFATRSRGQLTTFELGRSILGSTAGAHIRPQNTQGFTSIPLSESDPLSSPRLTDNDIMRATAVFAQLVLAVHLGAVTAAPNPEPRELRPDHVAPCTPGGLQSQCDAMDTCLPVTVVPLPENRSPPFSGLCLPSGERIYTALSCSSSADCAACTKGLSVAVDSALASCECVSSHCTPAVPSTLLDDII